MTTQDSSKNIDMLLAVPIKITVELGTAKMLVRDVLKLACGSIVELDRVAGSPIDMMVNERLVARGEIVAVEENFGIRVTELVGPVTLP